MKTQTSQDLLLEHEAADEYFNVDGIRSFRLDCGKGIPVVCIHGVPTSSYLYRKVIDSLADKGHLGISIDLPGLGLSDRPADFNYEFENYAEFLARAVDILNISKFHLLVHDIGGPIGFALAAKKRDQVLSLSILNTWIDVVNYEKPLVMKPFERKGIREAELRMITHLTWPIMFRQMGII